MNVHVAVFVEFTLGYIYCKAILIIYKLLKPGNCIFYIDYILEL